MYYSITWMEPYGESIVTGNYIDDLVEAGTCFESKFEAVSYYMDILRSGSHNISSLKIFKGNREITSAVNKFLSA